MRGDVGELARMDMRGNPAAAVEDCSQLLGRYVDFAVAEVLSKRVLCWFQASCAKHSRCWLSRALSRNTFLTCSDSDCGACSEIVAKALEVGSNQTWERHIRPTFTTRSENFPTLAQAYRVAAEQRIASQGCGNSSAPQAWAPELTLVGEGNDDDGPIDDPTPLRKSRALSARADLADDECEPQTWTLPNGTPNLLNLHEKCGRVSSRFRFSRDVPSSRGEWPRRCWDFSNRTEQNLLSAP